MDWTLLYGFLIAMGLFVAVWFVLVVPSERRDHARKLEILQKRIAEREQRRQVVGNEVSSCNKPPRADAPGTGQGEHAKRPPDNG